MAPHPDSLRHPWDPRFGIEIKTPAQAALWRKVLIAKIAVQVVVVVGLLALLGLTLKEMAFLAVFVGGWKAFDMWRNGRLNLSFWRKA